MSGPISDFLPAEARPRRLPDSVARNIIAAASYTDD